MPYDFRIIRFNGGNHAVGVFPFRIKDKLEITISWTEKDGTRLYPDIYSMDGDKARSYPTDKLKKAETLFMLFQ